MTENSKFAQDPSTWIRIGWAPWIRIRNEVKSWIQIQKQIEINADPQFFLPWQSLPPFPSCPSPPGSPPSCPLAPPANSKRSLPSVVEPKTEPRLFAVHLINSTFFHLVLLIQIRSASFWRIRTQLNVKLKYTFFPKFAIFWTKIVKICRLWRWRER